MELFIYYRVARAQAMQARAAVSLAQVALTSRWPGLVCRTMQRADSPETTEAVSDPSATMAPSTWMETYARPGSPLSALECELILAAMADLPPGRVGSRHVETFEPLGAVDD